MGGWLAAFLGRFARIRPFAAANGRAGAPRRIALAAPAWTAFRSLIPRDRTAAYRRGLIAAENGDPRELAALIGDVLLQSCLRLLAAAGDEPLEPLRTLAGSNYAALIKAARRGRLATVVREGRVFTTAAWIADYRTETGRN